MTSRYYYKLKDRKDNRSYRQGMMVLVVVAIVFVISLINPVSTWAMGVTVSAIVGNPYQAPTLAEVSLPEPREIINNYQFWSERVDTLTSNAVERSWLKRVMWCESKGDRFAKNKNSYASGLYQFMPSTFRGNGGKDIWNGFEQMEIALRMYRNGQAYQWACK